jgi:hypothetical protein
MDLEGWPRFKGVDILSIFKQIEVIGLVGLFGRIQVPLSRNLRIGV